MPCLEAEREVAKKTEALFKENEALIEAMNRHVWLKLGRFARIMTRDREWLRKRKRIEAAPAFSPPEPLPFKMEAVLDHLVKKGFHPQVILDVGAAKGYWSELAIHFFPQAQFYLLEPLSRNVPRLQELSGKFHNIHYVSCAAGERAADLLINVTPDGDGSSLLSFGRSRQPEDEVVKVVTIDSLLTSGTIQPPQLVKMDVQGYELRALAGGPRLFDSAEVFILEVSLYEFMPGTPLLHEVVAYMANRGYVLFDVAGFLKRPFEDDLAQMDLVFVKRGTALVASQQWMASAVEENQTPPKPSYGPRHLELLDGLQRNEPTGSPPIAAQPTMDLIFDIGMHAGDDTAHYLQHGKKVVAVEANPELVATAQRRFANELAEGRLIIVNKAVAPEPGQITFWVNKAHPEWSSGDRNIAAHGNDELMSLDIEAIPLVALFDEFGMPDYLKVDVEGYDRYCVATLKRGRRPAYFSCEYTGLDMLAPLVSAGYGRFKLICQFTHRCLAQRLEDPDFVRFELAYNLAAQEDAFAKAAQELCGARLWPLVKRYQELLSRGCPAGSSGPFGEEADGPWLSVAEIRRLDTELQETRQRIRSTMPLWCDLHAAANLGLNSGLCPPRPSQPPGGALHRAANLPADDV